MSSRAFIPGPSLAAVRPDLLRRVRAWNASSWSHGDRVMQVRAALARLSGMAAAADGLTRPPVPEVGRHALADQLDVLIEDARTAGAPDADVAEVLVELSGRLGFS